MSDDANRVSLRVGAGVTEEHERDVEVKADIGVSMETQGTNSARAGIGLMAIGMLSMIIGCVMYAISYPERWYESKTVVETIVLFAGVGVIVSVYGTALYYFGRHVAGRGRLQHFRLGETMEMSEDA